MRAREFINEVKMNPRSLEAMASNISAHAGMEFEMYVPDVGDQPFDTQVSPKPKSIDHVCDIFEENPENDITLLRQQLENDFYIWLKDTAESIWEFGEEDTDAYYEYIEQFAKSYRNNTEYMQKWFRYDDLNTIADIALKYDVQMPKFLTDQMKELANAFADVVNRPVKISPEWHGMKRDEVSYIIEPDGTLKQKRSPDDGGLEFISPPMPIEDMLFDLENVIHWAKEYGCYTNQKCGLHMNVSIDNIPIENLDYVKLAIFSGDDHVADSFGRLGGDHSRSSISIIQNNANLLEPDKIAKLLNQLKHNLNSIAHDIIYKGPTAHTMSMDIHSKWVEFRQPGGDWLNINPKVLRNTLLRFVVALDIACDPTKYQREYAKKLYKLLDPGADSNPIKIFTQFAAGMIAKEDLVPLLKARKREKMPDTNDVNKTWRVTIDRKSPIFARHIASNNPTFVDVHGATEDEAINAAVKILGNEYRGLPNSNFNVMLLVSK